MNRSRTPAAAVLAAPAVGLCAVLVACSSHIAGHGTASTTPSAAAPTTSATTPSLTASPSATITLTPTTSAAATKSTTAAATTTASSPPRIVSMTADYPKTCTPGDAITPELTWTVANANRVALSVDNPGTVGAYGTYGLSASIEMPEIDCPSTPGTSVTHQYDLWSLGATPQAHRTIVVTITALGTVSSTPSTPTTSPS